MTLGKNGSVDRYDTHTHTHVGLYGLWGLWERQVCDSVINFFWVHVLVWSEASEVEIMQMFMLLEICIIVP